MSTSKQIMRQLAEHREHAGITRQQVADRMGIADPSSSYVWGLEHGRRDLRLSTLLRYMRAIGVRLAYLPAENEDGTR